LETPLPFSPAKQEQQIHPPASLGPISDPAATQSTSPHDSRRLSGSQTPPPPPAAPGFPGRLAAAPGRREADRIQTPGEPSAFLRLPASASRALSCGTGCMAAQAPAVPSVRAIHCRTSVQLLQAT
jgi:hypothetical protein